MPGPSQSDFSNDLLAVTPSSQTPPDEQPAWIAALTYCDPGLVAELREAWADYCCQSRMPEDDNPFVRSGEVAVLGLGLMLHGQPHWQAVVRHSTAVTILHRDFLRLIGSGRLTVSGVKDRPEISGERTDFPATWASALKIDWQNNSARFGREHGFIGLLCRPSTPATGRNSGKAGAQATHLICSVDARNRKVTFDEGPVLSQGSADAFMAILGSGHKRRFIKTALLADQLGISQEAMPQRIKRLRDSLEDQFREISGRKLDRHEIIQSEGSLGYRISPSVATRPVESKPVTPSGG
jgi:hypothetical protein